MEVQLRSYPLEIFTAHFAITGQFTPRGLPTVFINDANYLGLTLKEARIQPLAQGGRVGAIEVEEAYIPKEEAQVIVMGGVDPDDAQLLHKTHRLMCFTDLYVLRGNFHTGSEALPADVFYFSGGPFYPASELELFARVPLAAEIKLEESPAPLAMVNRSAIRLSYQETS